VYAENLHSVVKVDSHRVLLPYVRCPMPYMCCDRDQDVGSLDCISVLVPLVAVTQQNAPTSVFPGSEGIKTSSRKSLSRSEHTAVTTAGFVAGEALVFDSRLLHSAGGNYSGNPRPLLSIVLGGTARGWVTVDGFESVL
jgi:ectoine hydroxylase-related dioxygenase (phytanoyl-CoA dioxygenase family)